MTGGRVSEGAAPLRSAEAEGATVPARVDGWPVGPTGLLIDAGWVALYLLFAGISTMLNPDGSNHAPLWLPTGLGLGLAMVWGWRPLPAIAVGAALFHGADELNTADWVPSAHVLLDVGAHVAGELLVTIGAALWIRRHTGAMPFGRIRHLLHFVVAAGIAFPALAATLVYLGDAVGWGFTATLPTETVHGYIAARSASALLAGPAVAAYLHGATPNWTRTNALQVATVFAYATVTAAVFWGPFEAPGLAVGLLIALAPPVVWLSMVLGRRVSLGALLVAASIAILGSEAGWGPLSDTLDSQARMLHVQFLHVALAYGTFYLAIANRQREEQLREAERENARLELLYRTDALTGLWNRHHLRAHLRDATRRLDAGAEGTEFSVLLLDIDHFKRVNDTHGHPAGDAVLVTVGGALVEAVRPSDVVGRWGGEEFLIVLPGCDAAQAMAVAETVRRRIAGIDHDLGERITISIGVASATEHSGPRDAVERADRALYAAKQAGRNRVQLAS
jgi:diguanylate cyclase